MTIKRRFVWVLYYATVLIKKSCESETKKTTVKGTGSTILIFHTFIKHMDSCMYLAPSLREDVLENRE